LRFQVGGPVARRNLDAIFHGTVQGVGFRYTTTRLAGEYDVAGIVRNLPDGTVQLVAEGEEAEIRAFLNALRQRLGRHVRRVDESWSDASGRYSGFHVAF